MEKHITKVSRTARYFTLGESCSAFKEVWFVLHGYGQLANNFLSHFEVLNDGSRLIVAPEALSRFYLRRKSNNIGATWMTSEERLAEIEDYIAYLDQVYFEVAEKYNISDAKINLLGFSQGTATATRWFERSDISFDHLILWGGHLAAEVNLENSKFKSVRLSFLYGDRDNFLLPSLYEEDEVLLKQNNVPYMIYCYEGVHEIKPEMLKKLAGV